MKFRTELNLYDGEVVIGQTARHGYYLLKNGVGLSEPEKLVSVTNITGLLDKSGPLMHWAVGLACDHVLQALIDGTKVDRELVEEARKMHYKRKKEAADLGTQVHDWAEAYINSVIADEPQPEIPEDEKVKNGVLAFLRWKDEHNVEFVSSERTVYSMEYHYAGKMDAEAIVDGELRVIDFKTSKRVYDEMRLQVAAYQRAAEEEGSNYTGNRMIARFDKETGDFDVHELEDQDKDFEAFAGLLAAKRRIDELKV